MAAVGVWERLSGHVSGYSRHEAMESFRNFAGSLLVKTLLA
jgi:hypothetical protein